MIVLQLIAVADVFHLTETTSTDPNSLGQLAYPLTMTRVPHMPV